MTLVRGAILKGQNLFSMTAYKHCFQPRKLIIDKKERSIVAETVLPFDHEYVCDIPIAVDECGKVHISDELGNGWGCSFACKTISEDDVRIILDMKKYLDEPVDEVREWLQSIEDDCPHLHHVKRRADSSDFDDSSEFDDTEKQGHPLPCADGTCQSRLRVLRAASVHYTNLRKLLHGVTMARQCHRIVANLDSALHSADFNCLRKLLGIHDYTELINKSGE